LSISTESHAAAEDPAPADAPAKALDGFEGMPVVEDGQAEDSLVETARVVPSQDRTELESRVVPPSFDVVRAEADGSTVIAGQAEPSSSVEILANGAPIVRVEADESGSWATFLDTLDPTRETVLSLRGIDSAGEGAVGDRPVLLLPPAEDSSVLAVTLNPDGDVGRLSGREAEQIQIEDVTYSESGDVEVGGSGPTGALVQVQVQRRDGTRIELTGDDIVVASPVDRGRWSALISERLFQPDTVYRIAVAAELPGGEVLDASIPFQWTQPEFTFGEGFVVVQPGNNLWVISRRVYGRGIRYHWIYGANADQIEDPDLIFPGQIFALPKAGSPLP